MKLPTTTTPAMKEIGSYGCRQISKMNTARLITFLTLLVGCGPESKHETNQIVPELIKADETLKTVEPTANAAPSAPATIDVLFKVIGIIDGDTIDVMTADKQTLRLRLNGIDTPERGQPFGNNATKFVGDAVGGKMVRIVKHDVDRYGRTIADVYLPVDDLLVNLPDMFLNRELVKHGLAWHFKQYSDDERLAQDEEKARAAELGLWSDPRHVAPWDWRKLSKTERDKLR